MAAHSEWQQVGTKYAGNSPQRQVRNDGLLVYRTNPRNRVFGICFSGLALLLILLFPLQSSFLLATLLFGIVGLGLATHTYDLTLNPIARTYRARYGFLPFVRVQEGTFADFHCLRVAKGNEKTPDAGWSVNLYWKNKRLPVFKLENTLSEQEAVQKGRQLGERLSLEVIEKDNPLARLL